MAGKKIASKSKPVSRPRAVTPKAGDEKLLQRMAALVSAHPDMELAEALESIGVEDAVGQRRLRKQFEARREELVGSAEAQRERRGKELQPAKAAALQAAKEPRVSSQPVQEAKAAEALDLAKAAMVAPPCAGGRAEATARGTLPMSMPWMKAGVDAFNSGLRVQSALIDAWLKLPPVSMALSQQATAYNALLGFAQAGRPKAR